MKAEDDRGNGAYNDQDTEPESQALVGGQDFFAKIDAEDMADTVEVVSRLCPIHSTHTDLPQISRSAR